MRRLHIFRAGRHTASSGQMLAFSEADLKAIADSYDPGLLEAPLVIGHPRTNDPAFGWVGALHSDGENLYATPHQVNPEFEEAVKAGSYKRVSASFYAPDAPNNPKPGSFYLRHVGFLGGKAPALKGLAPISFAEDEEGVVEFSEVGWFASTVAGIVRRFRDYLISKSSLEEADQIIPSYDIESLERLAAQDYAKDAAFSAAVGPAFEDVEVTPSASTDPDPNPAPDPADQTAEFAERERQLAEREAATAEREAAIAERERQAAEAEAAAAAEEARQARRVEYASFAEELSRSGRILPRHEGAVAGVLEVLSRAEDVVEFEEGDARPAIDTLRQVLGELPRAVDYRELAAGTADFSELDPAQLAKEAQLYQEAEASHGRAVSIVEAVKHVRSGQR